MEFLSGWIANIILFILLAIIIDMLLPNSNLQRYTKMVVGLLLLIIILTPILKIFTKNFEEIVQVSMPRLQSEEKNIENLIEFKKKEIQAQNRAYILEQMAVQMKEEVEDEVMNQYGMKVSQVSIDVDEQIEITEESMKHFSIFVELTEFAEAEEDGIPAVAVVNIDTKEPLVKKEDENLKEKEIISFLSEQWQLQTDQIIVAVEGGEAN